MVQLSKRDLETIGYIDDFLIMLREEVDAIGWFRDSDPGDRLYFHWAPMMKGPNSGTRGETEPSQLNLVPLLIERIVEVWPSYNASALEDVCGAIRRWHYDQNADNLPEQVDLEETMERASNALRTLRDRIMAKQDDEATTRLIEVKQEVPKLPARVVRFPYQAVNNPNATAEVKRTEDGGGRKVMAGPMPAEPQSDQGEWQPVRWFRRNTDVKDGALRQATLENRMTKRVRKRVVDGETQYSVDDARSAWPDQMRD